MRSRNSAVLASRPRKDSSARNEKTPLLRRGRSRGCASHVRFADEAGLGGEHDARRPALRQVEQSGDDVVIDVLVTPPAASEIADGVGVESQIVVEDLARFAVELQARDADRRPVAREDDKVDVWWRARHQVAKRLVQFSRGRRFVVVVEDEMDLLVELVLERLDKQGGRTRAVDRDLVRFGQSREDDLAETVLDTTNATP